MSRAYEKCASEVDNQLMVCYRISETAEELNDNIEKQRARATIGRVYLLRAQSNPSAHGSDEMVKSLKNAEKAFLQSLLICKRFDDCGWYHPR